MVKKKDEIWKHYLLLLWTSERVIEWERVEEDECKLAIWVIESAMVVLGYRVVIWLIYRGQKHSTKIYLLGKSQIPIKIIVGWFRGLDL